jgi:hypothetical protein
MDNLPLVAAEEMKMEPWRMPAVMDNFALVAADEMKMDPWRTKPTLVIVPPPCRCTVFFSTTSELAGVTAAVPATEATRVDPGVTHRSGMALQQWGFSGEDRLGVMLATNIKGGVWSWPKLWQ